MMTDNLTPELIKALAAAQGEIGNATKNAKNPHFKSNYADLGEVLSTVKPVFSKHEIAILQSPAFDGAMVTVTTILAHASGGYVSSTASCVPAKADAQGIGAATTYLRRYSLAAMAAIGQEDDDGNAAAHNSKPAKTDLREQVEKEAIKQDCLDNLLSAYSVKAISELTETDLRKAKKQLADRLKQGGTNAAGD